MKINILFLLAVLPLSVFGQKNYCSDNFELDSTKIIIKKNKTPYDNNTRALLEFTKKEITHSGCNKNPYNLIVDENFDSDLDSSVFGIYSSSDSPYEDYDPNLNTPYEPLIYEERNVIFKDGIATLKIRDEEVNKTYTYTQFPSPLDSTSLPYDVTCTVKGYSAGRLINRETEFGAGWDVEDCGCYKYGKFSSRVYLPKTDDASFALWFFGCGNEIDVFEIFHGTNNKTRSSIHQWNVITDNNDTHAEYGLDYFHPDILDAFHTWELEWTPYKIAWSLDGNVFRTFYKYYTLHSQTNQDGAIDKICLVGLDCDDLSEGDNEVWEIDGWNAFSTRPIDLIIGPGLLRKGKPVNKDFLLDFIKVEQRPNMKITLSDNSPCVGEEINISASNTDQIVNWTVSDNLEIISLDENNISIVGNQDGTLGWIEAKVIGNNVDLPPNNWTTVGYNFNEEFQEAAVPFHNFSFNCHDSEITVRKEILIGRPVLPKISDNLRPCLLNGGFEITIDQNQFYDSTNIYSWSSIDAEIIEYNDSIWVTPDTSLENNFLEFQLEITNECGVASFLENILIPECEKTSDPPQLIIYPNPANQFLHFGLVKTNYEITLPAESSFYIVKSGTGEIVYQGELGEFSHTINSSNWGESIYEIFYHFKDQTFSKSFSVIH